MPNELEGRSQLHHKTLLNASVKGNVDTGQPVTRNPKYFVFHAAIA
jgi:hypothetical protein